MSRNSYTAPKASKSQASFIDALGGNTKVARKVSERMGLRKPLNRSAVGQWKVRGIPYAYRAALTALALEEGVSVPDDLNGMPGAA